MFTSNQRTNESDFHYQLSRAQDVLHLSKRIVVFTGAGISVESGIPTFRDDGSLWRRFPPSQFANWRSIIRLAQDNPTLLAEFAVAVFKPIALASPNPAHAAIAALEGGAATITVITQNIDGLHQVAGSANVIEIHGSAFEIVQRSLLGTQKVTRLSRPELAATVAKLELLQQNSRSSLTDFLEAAAPIFGVGMNGPYHPNLVMFGDMLPTEPWQLAVTAATECDCMLIVGTSQLVVPAATLPTMAKNAGAHIIRVDPADGECDIWLRGAAGGLLPRLFRAD